MRAGGDAPIRAHSELGAALVSPKPVRGGPKVLPHLPVVVYSERAAGYSANAIAVWFLTRFREIGIKSASSHSGQRSFITAAAKKLRRPAVVCATSSNW